MIQFTETDHLYTSVVPDTRNWISVTTLVGGFSEPFNKEEKAAKCSVRKPDRYPNKWYGYSPEEILAAWDAEGKRSIELGHWYHSKQEQELYTHKEINGLPVVKPIISNGIKYAPKQKLSDGIYPEHMVYLDSVGICGQSDLVTVQGGFVDITDHKTSKEIRREGFRNWEGTVSKMLRPVQHLDECEFSHYALQLSIYIYIICRHNPMLLPGKLTINHVKFVQNGQDKWGYPVHMLENGEPVVDSIEPITLPYMQKEVQSIITWLKDDKNRQSLIKH